ncbi:MAG: hypothetical protein JW820_11455 [Spirochaetales bacterium]|nr:hypothetical protein [Spirochaetales bacterium]
MISLERELLHKALEKFGRIEPCVGRTLAECFLRQNGKVQFWFNDLRGNTHLLYADDRAVSAGRR